MRRLSDREITTVAVIGAGAAGLAAARRLRESGLDTLVLEARNRAGGRAYTLRTNDGAFPIELGAEFIHGKAETTMALLREFGEDTVPIDSASPDLWTATERVLERVDLDAPDRSVDEFLNDIGVEGVKQARMLIEGFDAAVTADASIKGIAREWRSAANETDARPANGYGILMQRLADMLTEHIRFDTRVETVEWERGGVSINAMQNGEPVRVQARCAIVTLPIGVLRNGGVQFSPQLPREIRHAIHAVAMGPVVKVVLHFLSIFWDGGFYLTPSESGFRTVWSRLPQRAPVLVAWAGGDAAQALIASGADPVEAALTACETLFPRARVRETLAASYYHDWQRDPYACGAYSYLRVNGGAAREQLAIPIEDTLFFAGEAASPDDSGTVAGALASGYRAAAQVSSVIVR